jgi:predicted nucleic acid-binding protein
VRWPNDACVAISLIASYEEATENLLQDGIGRRASPRRRRTTNRRLALHSRWHPTHCDLRRTADLMDRYADRPMDFADASLTAIAERLTLERIVTIDRTDFSIYRLHDRKPFVIVGP